MAAGPKPHVPLWRGAALQALKTLVRKHPGAAFAAARSGLAYIIANAGPAAAHAVRRKAGSLKVQHRQRPDTGLEPGEVKALMESLDEDARDALKRVASHRLRTRGGS
jgi:hypothetical protein